MAARTRVTIEGTLGEGADVWNTSFHMGASSGYSLANLQDAVEEVDSLWQSTVWTASGSGCLFDFPNATKYVKTTLRDITSAGITARVVEAGPAVPIAGTDSANSLPTEVAVVVSLITDTAGARGRGRMYVPPMSLSNVTTGGLISSGAGVDLLDAFEAFFEGLNASTLVPDDVSVYSGADATLREVSTIRVGSVFDSQRRRRNAIPETYQSRAITH